MFCSTLFDNQWALTIEKCFVVVMNKHKLVYNLFVDFENQPDINLVLNMYREQFRSLQNYIVIYN